MRLLVAGGLAEDHAKGDQADLDWAERAELREITIAGRSVLWQPAFRASFDADLVITEQASKQLFNVALSIGQRAMTAKHCFWGHGKNFQESIEPSGGEGLKRRLTERAHWFFAYNETSARAAVEYGMNPDRITSVMNSTDTKRLRDVRLALPADIETRVRSELGMGEGPVALYLGGVYGYKRPEFVVAAAQEIRNVIPDFEMLVIGDGSARQVMIDAAKRHTWFHYVGSCYGDQRVALASVASVQLMPGLVGLNVVDAFALGLPTITTDIDYHSPEIEYLVDGHNGVVTAADATPKEFAAAVADLLGNPQRLELLQRNAKATGESLSIEDMASRLVDGIEAALAAPRR